MNFLGQSMPCIQQEEAQVTLSMIVRNEFGGGLVPSRGSLRGKLRRVWLPVVSLWLLIALPGLAAAQDAIKPGETLDLNRCINIALAHHPNLLGAQGSLKASRSRVYEAKSGYYPQVSANSAYTRNHSFDTDDREGETSSLYRNSVDLSQTIFDFGRTSSAVKVQSSYAQASRADLDDTTRQVVFNVKLAYYGILRSRQSREAYIEAVRQLQLHLDQARRFYEVGIKARIDVTNAEVNLSQAKLNLVNVDNALHVARLALNNAMGMPDAPVFEVREETGTPDYAIDLDSALKKAYEQRPDLLSAQARREAAKRSVDLARREYYPVLSGNAGYGYAGEKYPLDDEWTLGATLNFPLFTGFLTKYQIEEAKANLETAQANEALVRQNVRFDVEQAFYELKNAREKINLAALTVKQAKENRELALGRYASEVGSPIEVADAVAAEVSAKTSYSAALFDYRLAIASLQKAMGENR